jgi:hypothetical protein
VLVVLTMLLLMAMPVTEHLCNWDRFLRGGPDVEFSVLAWLLFAAMVVLSMHGAMLRPPAMQPGRMRAAADANDRKAQKEAALCGLQAAEEFWSSGRNELEVLFDLPAAAPMRI